MNATTKAIDELKKALETEENPQRGIRIFAQQGCCGPSLQMSVAENATTGDKVVTIDEVNFFIAPPAAEMLESVTIDYGPNGFRLDGLHKGSGGCCG